MADHQNTVRDLVRLDGYTTELANRLTYDAFGRLVTQTAVADSGKQIGCVRTHQRIADDV